MSQVNIGVAKIGWGTLASVAVNTLAMLAFSVGALTSHQWIGLGLAGVTMAMLALIFYRTSSTAGYVAAQALVLGGLLVTFERQIDNRMTSELLAATGLIILAVLLNQDSYRRLLNAGLPRSAHLAGARLGARPLIKPDWLLGAPAVLIFLVGVSVGAHLPAWPISAATCLVALAFMVVGMQLLRRRGGGHRTQTIIRRAVEQLKPEFVFYFSAPMGSEYHVTMWLPYMERMGRPYLVVMREREAFRQISALASVPMVLCESVAEVDNIVVPTLRAAFYANNGMKNVHMVRFNQLTHVQLLHGDSDKASSYNPVTAMFDKIYVAGQAGIDRYAANNVYIDPEKFVIVGRPQVSTIATATGPIREVTRPTVLYATTWSGLYADADYSSVANGPKIVAELLRRGCTVIFRPHPLTRRTASLRMIAAQIDQMLAADRAKTGRPHLYGNAATTSTSLIECFNKADAMISDVSGVASDFLYSGKPLAMTDMLGAGPRFAVVNPLARAAYVLNRDAGNLTEVLDDLLRIDPLAETRLAVKKYYLGDFPPETYGDGFVRAALAELDRLPAAVQVPVPRAIPDIVPPAPADQAALA